MGGEIIIGQDGRLFGVGGGEAVILDFEKGDQFRQGADGCMLVE